MFSAYKFQNSNCPHLSAGLGDIVVWMLQSRKYSLATGWVCGSNGFAIDAARAAALWRICNIDCYAHLEDDKLWDDVGKVLFSHTASGISQRNQEVATELFNPEYRGLTFERANASVVGGHPATLGHDSIDQDSGMAHVLGMGSGLEVADGRLASAAVDTTDDDEAEEKPTAEDSSFIDDSAVGSSETAHNCEGEVAQGLQDYKFRMGYQSHPVVAIDSN